MNSILVNFRDIFLKHYPAVLLAMAIGLSTMLPQIIAVESAPNFNGILKTINNDEVYYLSRAKDVMDGHNFVSNPYLAEHKNDPPFQVWLPDFLMAKPLAVLGVHVQIGFLFYDFLLTAILALLSYFVIYILTKSEAISLAGVIFMNLHLFLFLYNRAPSPQFNFIFFILVLIFLLRYNSRPTKNSLLLIAFSYGLLFYIYPYYWTFFAVQMVLQIGVFFLLSFYREAKDLALAFLGGILLGLPYFIQNFEASVLPSYADSMMRLGLLNTRFPSGLTIVACGILVLFSAFLCWFFNRAILKDRNAILMISGVVAAIIVVNQHIITGKNLEFSSHYLPLALFWFIVTVLYLVVRFVEIKFARRRLLIYGAILILSAVIGAKTMAVTFSSQAIYGEAEIENQDYAVVFDWLDENAKKDDVVFADSSLGALITVYTALNVWYLPSANLFYVPTEELNRRFFINHYFEKIDRQFIAENERALFGTHYVNSFAHNQSKNKLRSFFGLPAISYDRLPEDEINRMLSLARSIQKSDFGKLLGEFRVDYLIRDKLKDRDWNLSDYKFLKKELETERFEIYRVGASVQKKII